MMRSWARRSRDAATIFIALVICCVDLTAGMRRRRSNTEGMGVALPRGRLRRRSERVAEFLERRVEVGLERVVDLLLVGERGQEIGLARLEELIEIGLVAARVLEGDGVEIAVGRRVDDDHLLLDRE